MGITKLVNSFIAQGMNEVSWWSRCGRKLWTVDGSNFVCSAMLRHVFDTIIVVSTDKEWLY